MVSEARFNALLAGFIQTLGALVERGLFRPEDVTHVFDDMANKAQGAGEEKFLLWIDEMGVKLRDQAIAKDDRLDPDWDD